MNFNEILITERKKRGLNQEQLAELLNVSRQSISKWENGESFPEYAKLIALSDVLGCSLDYLCGRAADVEIVAAARPAGNKKYIWLAVLLIIVALVVGVFIGRATVETEAPSVELPAAFNAQLVGLSTNADRVLKCEFLPDFVDENFEYQLVFRNSFDGEEEVFPVVPQAGTMIFTAELKYHYYSSLSLVVKKEEAQKVAVLARDIVLGESQVSWSPVE